MRAGIYSRPQRGAQNSGHRNRRHAPTEKFTHARSRYQNGPPGEDRRGDRRCHYVTQLPLSILDLAPVSSRGDTAEALQFTTELARQAERWGYRRFWVAEHHNMPAIASSAPAVLLAHLAAATSTIRIGSGGVMLPNHAPLVVAEQFGTLESLHPGRIDLGVGRAPGTDQRTALALRRTVEGLSAEDFPNEFADLVAMLSGDPGRLRSVPTPENPPQFWLLGSSGFSAQLAGLLGLPFSFAHHFSAVNTEPALALYRNSFRPSQWLEEPYAMVAVNAVCADTDERAEYLAKPGLLSFLKLRAGQPIALPTPEEAADYQFSAAELAFVAQRRQGQAMGSPATVAQQLTELLGWTGADELMLTNQVYDLTDRLRSYELIAALELDRVPARS
jgi:luciferase family oxidoreductase group 1